jgi:hypothetical protein
LDAGDCPRPGVLVLQIAQLRQALNSRAREPAFPFEIVRLADAVLGAQLNILKEANDLIFDESSFLYVGIPLVGILFCQLNEVFDGAAKRSNSLRHL